jgi:hypothetical protein
MGIVFIIFLIPLKKNNDFGITVTEDSVADERIALQRLF